MKLYKSLVILLNILPFWATAQYPAINPDNIIIVRDSFGTPHIFAKTDAEVAYGLAWANAEDAFNTMQEALILGQGKMGRYNGKEGAAIDFFVHSIGAEELYKKHKEDYDLAYLKYVDGYCQGVNAYAAAHPEEVLLKKTFPIEVKDVLMTFIVSFAALAGVPDYLKDIVEGKYDEDDPPFALGSNAYAFNSTRTEDGKTYLCINPHFLIEGPLSFYDAHLHSDEGLNITGTLFQGGTSVFMGNNEHLGWGQTYNHVDQVDAFELKMHPRKKLYYEFDSQYIKLEKRPVWLKVKIGKIVIPVRKMTYWSKYGPTFKSKEKRFFALRSPSFWNYKAGEQYYKMNKAKTFEQFKAALRMNALPMFNIVYADRFDNIYYLGNSKLPKRDTSFDYSKVLGGTGSATLWTEYYSLDEKPHVENPSCGFVYNMNNTPTHATCEEENFPQEKMPPYANLRPGDNNRSIRFLELIEGVEKIDWEYFKAIKFDRYLSKNTNFYKSMQNLYQIQAANYPHLSEPIRIVQSWSGDANWDNDTATIFLLTLKYIFKKKDYSDKVFITGVDISEKEYIEGIEDAARFLNKHYNSLYVPLRKVISHYRNEKYLPAGGFPDMLSPGYTEKAENGKYKMIYGDTFIQFVKFGKEGPEVIQSLIPFENHRNVENYRDELELFNKQQLKTMSLDKVEVMEKAQEQYHPKVEE